MKLSKKDLHLGKNKSKSEKKLIKFDKENVIKRIWDKDPTVWKKGKEPAESIKNRLGWLSLPVTMKSTIDDINSLVNEVKGEGFTYAVVLGMGGSSMCPEVLSETFGVKEGFLKLFVLDSTDPLTIIDCGNSIDIEKTLFIVSSKSGGTIEVDSFFRYFFEKVKSKKGAGAGRQFIAITDNQTALESLAKENGFRKIFTNPSDIGGRYSALSYFGLVPAALLGIDIQKLLSNAEDMMDDCSVPSAEKNPGAVIGAIAGSLNKKKMDKITFIFSRQIRSFGYWVEQLIAESTGKEGKGILPVEGENTGKPSTYGNDRLFVFMNIMKDNDEKKPVKKLIKNNFPVIEIELKDKYDLGGQFYLWEFATSVMGAVMGINPFDEPNVKESKDNTAKVLKAFEENKKLPDQVPKASKNNLRIYFNENLFEKKLPSGNKLIKWDLEDYIEFFFDQCRKGDYIALMAYINKNKITEDLLLKIRELLREKTKLATTLGYGPRFLHSTGQLHKGGPDKGVFVQIVSDDSKDIEIPGKPYSFRILKESQALGDFESLIKHDRRVLRVNIGVDIGKGLSELYKMLKKIL